MPKSQITAQHLRLEMCSGDSPSFGYCPNPANWMLLPFEGAEEALRSPFCNDCAKVIHELFPEANPEGFQMTIRQAHLWIAQGRLCICPHPGSNCTQPSSVVINTMTSGSPEVMAICTDCIACSNGFLEGFQDIINGLFPQPTLKGS